MGEHQKPGALLRRIAPSVPLDFTFINESGEPTTASFRLAFNYICAARIEQRTEIADKKTGKVTKPGLRVNDMNIWQNLISHSVVWPLLWGAVILNHPEYNTDEGYEAIGSLIDEDNHEPIVERLFAAYLLYCTPEKRGILEESVQKAKEAREKQPTEADPQPPPEKEIPAAKKRTPIVGVGPNAGRPRATTSDSAMKSSAT